MFVIRIPEMGFRIKIFDQMLGVMIFMHNFVTKPMKYRMRMNNKNNNETRENELTGARLKKISRLTLPHCITSFMK